VTASVFVRGLGGFSFSEFFTEERKAMHKGLMAVLVLVLIPHGAMGGMLGAEAPDFSLRDLKGNPVSLSGFSGTPVVIFHFNTYCHSCREEVPIINRLQKEHKGVQLVGIAIGNDERETREFKASFKAEFLLVPDPQKEVYENYFVHTVPLIDIVDRTGTIRYRGKFPGDVEFRSIIEKIVEEREVMVGAQLWNRPPDFTLPGDQGETFRLYDVLGKNTVLLGFVSVRDEMIHQFIEIMKSRYSRYKREDVDIVRIAVKDSLEEVREFRKKYHVNFPMLVDEKGKVADLYGVTDPPKVFIMNKKGRIRYVNEEIRLDNLVSRLAKVKSYIMEELPEELLEGYLEKAAPEVEGFDKVIIGDDQIVYVGTSQDNKKILAREVFKDVLCDVCTNIHFVYSFDQRGRIRNIALIESIDLYGVPIDATDFLKRVIEKANQKLPLRLREDVDALSGATQSCKLILEGLNETPDILASLEAYQDALATIGD
jgi:peroxiredoxin